MQNRLVSGLLVLALYIGLGTLLAYYARRKGVRRAVDYYVAGYRLGGLLAALTYAATTYSAFMIVGLVGLTYLTGVPSFGFELTYFVATLAILAAIGPKAWSLARERKWISPAEMLGDLYGSKILSIIVALLYVVALLPYIGAQIKGIAEAVSGLSGGAASSYSIGILLGLAVILVWTLIGGLWSVAVTDALQGLLMIAAGVSLLLWLFSLGSPQALGKAIELLGDRGLLSANAWPFNVFVAFTVPWIFFAVTNPQVVQRLFMPSDKKAYRAMVLWFALFGLSYTVVVTLIGLIARGYSEIGLLPSNLATPNRDAVTPNLLNYTYSWLSALVFTSIVAAAVSTADSIILSVASSIARDIYGTRSQEDKMLILVGKASVAVLAVLAALIGYARVGFIVSLSVLSSLLLLPLAPITIGAWLMPSRARGKSSYAIASIVLGIAVSGATLLAASSPKGALTLVFYGLPTPLWVLLVSTIPVVVGFAFAKRH